jgi:hypothetical protein
VRTSVAIAVCGGLVSAVAIAARVGTAAEPGLDARAALRQIDAERARAFAAPSAADVSRYAEPTGPVAAADRSQLAALAAAGRRLDTPAITLTDVRVLDVHAAEATLAVRDELAAYAAYDATGRVVQRWPGRGPATWLVRLRRGHGRWRLFSVERMIAG